MPVNRCVLNVMQPSATRGRIIAEKRHESVNPDYFILSSFKGKDTRGRNPLSSVIWEELRVESLHKRSQLRHVPPG